MPAYRPNDVPGDSDYRGERKYRDGYLGGVDEHWEVHELIRPCLGYHRSVDRAEYERPAHEQSP